MTRVAEGTHQDPRPPGRDGTHQLQIIVDGLGRARAAAASAITDAERCGSSHDLLVDASQLDEAAQTRDVTAKDLADLRLDDPRLRHLASLLATALRVTATADRHYADWTRDLAAEGCSPGRATDNPHYRDGNLDRHRANQAKIRFVRAWNGEADQYGFDRHTRQDL